MELGQQMRVSGTPTLVFASGRTVSGAIPVAELEKYLNEAGSR